jgi:mannose-6-phosphate isomerase-like protein (cupin superfamily)
MKRFLRPGSEPCPETGIRDWQLSFSNVQAECLPCKCHRHDGGIGDQIVHSSGGRETKGKAMEASKNTDQSYEVERKAQLVMRPDFRITEMQISKTQKVPWHYHSHVKDTFYVLEGSLRIFMQSPKEEVRLAVGETCSVAPGRPHLVTNGGVESATFLVLQIGGEHDFIPLLPKRA